MGRSRRLHGSNLYCLHCVRPNLDNNDLINLPENQKPSQTIDLKGLILVAGVGFEPTTFRL